MRDNGVVCVIDTGTTSMRCILYDINGRPLFTQKKISHLIYLDDGGVEQNAEVFCDSLFDLITAANGFSCENNLQIKAFSLTSQRSSVLPVNRDGIPLRPILMWQDTRSESICNEMGQRDEIYKIAGLSPCVTYSAPKILWLKRNERAIYDEAYKIIGIHEYLLHCMTGRFCTDHSIASRTNLLDIRTLEWSKHLLDVFSIDRSKLCDLVPAGSICGYTTDELAKRTGIEKNTPVITAGGDQQCAALGLGLIKPGTTMINVGTGAYVATITDKVKEDHERQVNCNVAATNGSWLIESSTPCAGLAYDWAKKTLFSEPDKPDRYDRINTLAEKCPPGAGGTVSLPGYLTGREGMSNMIYPLQLKTEPMHIARAVIEGIAADIYECAEAIKRTGCELEQYICAGGLFKFRLFAQILSDMLGHELIIYDDLESTARGALINAWTALNVSDSYSEAIDKIKQEAPEIIKPNHSNMAIYKKVRAQRELLKRVLKSIIKGETNE